VVLRLVIAAVAVAVVVLLASNLRDARACDRGRADLFQVVIGHLPASREAAALTALQRRCRGTDGLVAAAAALDRQGRDRQALGLAYRATAAEPQSATAWNALAVVAARSGRRALAVRAAAQARRLSPLGQPPLPSPGRARAGHGGGP
jgi:Flp pilus assembly protein TadD